MVTYPTRVNRQRYFEHRNAAATKQRKAFVVFRTPEDVPTGYLVPGVPWYLVLQIVPFLLCAGGCTDRLMLCVTMCTGYLVLSPGTWYLIPDIPTWYEVPGHPGLPVTALTHKSTGTVRTW